MKVADVMQKHLLSVSEDTPVREVSRMIFSLGIAGVPVVKEGKLVGIVTEHDILSKLYPTIQELDEDYIHARDFESMEKNLKGILYEPVKKIMNKAVASLVPSASLLEAQSLMLRKKIGRVPITDEKGTLLGIISQGDIFRYLLRQEMPIIQKERYADFIARYYDDMVKWEPRFAHELPTLLSLFKKYHVASVLDVGVWTGEYTIRLLNQGHFDKIIGLDHNAIMIKMSNNKKEQLPKAFQDKISFIQTNFTNLTQDVSGEGPFDVILCMGNSLPYIPETPEVLCKSFKEVLSNNGIVIFQLLNLKKIFQSKSRLLSFTITQSKEHPNHEQLSVEFFDKKAQDMLSHHVIIFESDGGNWIYKGNTTIPIRYITKEDIEKALKKAGFTHITFSGNRGEYQGEYGDFSFNVPFNASESDFLNVLARR